MKKFIYTLIIIGVFLISGCDNTTTSNLLDGDFVPADTSPPSILGPEDGEVVLNLTADLRWTSKEGVSYYVITVATDAEFTNQIADSPFVVYAPTTYRTLTLPAAGRYYWRIGTSETAANQYDESYFDAREDCLYVHFPYDPANPNAKPDDSDKTGNIDAPFQTINRAMADAYKMGISTVKVASRGEISSGNFSAYTESLSFRDGVSLEGGWNPAFTVRHDFSTGLENNEYETRIEGKYNDPITIENIYSFTVIEGFAIRTLKENGLKIENCGRDLVVRSNVISLLFYESKMISTGIYISKSDVRIQGNLITAEDITTSMEGLDVRSTGIELIWGEPEIIGNAIRSANCSGVLMHSTSIGMKAQTSSPILVNNTIIGGSLSTTRTDATLTSYGLIFYADTTPVLINNTIAGGSVASATTGSWESYGLQNNSNDETVAINNIFTTFDTDGDRYGVDGVGTAIDVNFHYNCIYGNGGTDYQDITADATNVFVDPAFVSVTDFHLTATSPATVTGGGVIDPFTIAGITLLDEYLIDITGADRTPDYVQGGTDMGWSMGAYEY